MSVAGLIDAFKLTFKLLVGGIATIKVMFFIAAGFVDLGVAVGSAINDFYAFHLTSTFVIWPLFMLSAVFFPIDVAPIPLRIARAI